MEVIRDIMDDVEGDPDYAYEDTFVDAVGRWFSDHFVTMDKTLHAKVGPTH